MKVRSRLICQTSVSRSSSSALANSRSSRHRGSTGCDISRRALTGTQTRRWRCRERTSPCTSCRFPPQKKKKEGCGGGWKAAKQALSGRSSAREDDRSERTGKRRGHFDWDCTEHAEVGLVSDEQGDDLWACVFAQLFDPGLDVRKGRGFGDIIQ